MVEETKNETSKTHRSKIILSQSKVFGPKPKLLGQGSKKAKFIIVKKFFSANTVSFWSIEIPKKVFGGFENVFHVYLKRGFQKYGRN